jgi:alpha-beta hydrolase superfamily lysophospholipase
MGGAIVLQFLTKSPLAKYVSAVVLDAPMLSVPQMLTYISGEHHIPALITRLTIHIANWRTGIDICQTDVIGYPPKVHPPMTLQGTADKVMPVQTAQAFAESSTRAGWPVRCVKFPGAGHSESWTSNTSLYESAVDEFLQQLLRK